MAKKKAVKKAKKVGIVATVEMDTNKNGCSYWRLVAHNDETLASSEAYSSWGACHDTASEVARHLGVSLTHIAASE